VEKLGLVQGCVAGWSIISREGRPGKIYYDIVSVFAIKLLSRQVYGQMTDWNKMVQIAKFKV
jgi:hypothetical protein